MPRNISYLIPELLAKCFLHTRDHAIDTEAPYAWLHITWVCKYWHDVALNCPSLWSYIDLSKCRLRMVQLHVERSRAARLTVILTRSPDASSVSDIMDKIAAVVDQLHRVEDLTFHVRRGVIDQCIAQFSDPSAAPLLRSASITVSQAYDVDSDRDDGPLPFIFESPMLMLTSLKLSHFSYHRMRPLLQPNLRYLTIETHEYPSVDVLIDSLQSMPRLEVLALWKLYYFIPRPRDAVTGCRKQLRLNHLKSLTLMGSAEIDEFLARLVVPPSEISVYLSIGAESVAADGEKIHTILDAASALSRCGFESARLFDTTRIVRTMYIDINTSYMYEIWGWSSILPPTIDPSFWLYAPFLGDREWKHDGSFIYRLGLVLELAEGDPDGIPTLCCNLDFSHVQTLILTASDQSWDSHRDAIRAVFSTLNNTVETLVALRWDLLPLAAFLTTGDCENTTALIADADDTLTAQPSIPFPRLHTLSVAECDFYEDPDHDYYPKSPLTSALMYRAKHGCRIQHLHVGAYSRRCEDLKQAYEFATNQHGRDLVQDSC